MEAKLLNGLALAYLGDSVFELEIRQYLLNSGITKVNNLNKKCVEFTKGLSQAKFINYLISNNVLTEEEINYYKKGRNSHIQSVRHNIDIKSYLDATGFESLIGYLYIENKERLKYIIDLIIEKKEGNEIE